MASELERVGKQVHEHLFEQRWIGRACRQIVYPKIDLATLLLREDLIERGSRKFLRFHVLASQR